MKKSRAYRIGVCGTREKFSEYCVICVTIGILTELLQEACQSSWVQRYSNSLKHPNVFQTFLWTSCICPLHFFDYGSGSYFHTDSYLCNLIYSLSEKKSLRESSFNSNELILPSFKTSSTKTISGSSKYNWDKNS